MGKPRFIEDTAPAVEVPNEGALDALEASPPVAVLDVERSPVVGDLVLFHIEGENASPVDLAAQVLFVHSPVAVTLVTTKHQGARHTHSSVQFGSRTGQWSWRS